MQPRVEHEGETGRHEYPADVEEETRWEVFVADLLENETEEVEQGAPRYCQYIPATRSQRASQWSENRAGLPEIQSLPALEEVEQLDVQVDRNRDGGALESGDKRVDSRVP